MPIFLVLFILLGFAAGVKVMLRTAQEVTVERRGTRWRLTRTWSLGTEAAGPGSNIHPMDQFIIEPLFGDGAVAWYTPTNVALWMAIAVACTALLLVLGTRGRAVVPSRIQSVAELAYGFVHKMVEDVTGREGLKYFPYIMTLFMFIVFANMLGLLADVVRADLAHRGHRGSGADRLPQRDDPGLRQERLRVSSACSGSRRRRWRFDRSWRSSS